MNTEETVTVELRLPESLLDELAQVASMAGVSVNEVANVLLAMYIRQAKQEG